MHTVGPALMLLIIFIGELSKDLKINYLISTGPTFNIENPLSTIYKGSVIIFINLKERGLQITHLKQNIV